MDLQVEIARAGSRKQVEKIVKYVGGDAARFALIVSVFLRGPYRLTQRAAQPLGYCVERYPELIAPHLKKILDLLDQPDAPVAVKRNMLRMLQFTELPKKFQGRIIQRCFDLLMDKREPVAVHVFAMSVLNRLVQDIPEMKQELRLIIEDRLPYASPAFISRARKVLRT